MPESPLMVAGAQVQPTAAAPLHTNEFFTGLWTQGNPLGPGAVPYLYQKFYSASRYDRLIGGINLEVTTRLTLARRPGNSIYNSQLFPPINRFYEFRTFQGLNEQIHLMASVDPATGSNQGTVRDVTGPATNLTLQTKDPAAGKTSFVSVGNQLFWGDGVNTQKWTLSKQAWAANTAFPQGTFIIDSNNNVQESVGAQTAQIANIQVDVHYLSSLARTGPDGKLVLPPAGRLVTLSFSNPLDIVNGVNLTLAGLTTVPALNGLVVTNAVVQSSLQIQFYVGPGSPYFPPTQVYFTETGTATTGTGITGSTPPVFNETIGGVTVDGGEQWICKGSSVTAWGTGGPALAPTVTQKAGQSIYPKWAASTWYGPLLIITDSNGNLQQLTTGGVLGTAAPTTWNATVGGTTNDGTAVWTNKGTGTWPVGTAVTKGQVIVVTYTYYITYQRCPNCIPQLIPVTVTAVMQCTVAGTTGLNQPAWVDGLGSLTTESTGVVWQNMGPPPLANWAALGASAKVSTATTVIDSNFAQEVIQTTGESGSAAPSPWATTVGQQTTESGPAMPAVWQNNGGAQVGSATLPWMWGYSYASSVTQHIGNMSPPSAPLVVSPGNVAILQGVGGGDPQDDEIIVWRTKAGGSTFFQIDTIPNPGAGHTWVFTDTTPDAAITGTALIAPQLGGGVGTDFSDNSPPPAGFIPCCYYLNRIWGFVGNVLKYSGGPDTNTGSGNESFPGDNEFDLPSNGVTCWPTSIGLIVFTISDTWILLGQGTYDGTGNPVSPFYLVNFQAGVGIMSADALCVNGSTAYVMLTSGQVVSMDPGAGETEVGFPIGDIFDNYFSPVSTYLAWHQGKSRDTALFVADGTESWYRMAAVAAPESGNVWSPPARIASAGQVKAIASVETSPGIKALVLGPSVAGNPILKRDLTTWQDAGVSYPANAYISSVVLAQPGMVAGVQFVVIEEAMIAGATAASVALLFDEILSTQVPSSSFLTLRKKSADPPNLPPSKSVRTQRLWAAQDANSVVKCRHYQQAVLWPAENYPNELWTNTVYGRLPEKARR